MSTFDCPAVVSILCSFNQFDFKVKMEFVFSFLHFYWWYTLHVSIDHDPSTMVIDPIAWGAFCIFLLKYQFWTFWFQKSKLFLKHCMFCFLFFKSPSSICSAKSPAWGNEFEEDQLQLNSMKRLCLLRNVVDFIFMNVLYVACTARHTSYMLHILFFLFILKWCSFTF